MGGARAALQNLVVKPFITTVQDDHHDFITVRSTANLKVALNSHLKHSFIIQFYCELVSGRTLCLNVTAHAFNFCLLSCRFSDQNLL